MAVLLRRPAVGLILHDRHFVTVGISIVKLLFPVRLLPTLGGTLTCRDARKVRMRSASSV